MYYTHTHTCIHTTHQRRGALTIPAPPTLRDNIHQPPLPHPALDTRHHPATHWSMMLSAVRCS